MSARFLVGDVRARMAELPDSTFDLILCSPPFLALRSYLADGHPDKHLEIGSEATPADYLDVLLALTAEWGRLLAPHGSIAIELGDTYAGSGGAGGDYNADGLRDGQQAFSGSAAKRAAHGVGDDYRPSRAGRQGGWPLDKSLVCIPQLYQVALAYGINPLTGQASPAGRWRVRNLKPWIRSNPPVGALGDKERPATSYVIVACRARDRWFDLDAVRTSPQGNPRSSRESLNRGEPGYHTADDEAMVQWNPAGAPPRDWWHIVDAVIDTELALRAGQDSNHNHVLVGNKMSHEGRLSDDNTRSTSGSVTVGAQGVHLRRALERAGILTTLEALDISPKGYAGAHYAVWPPELVRQLVNEMCPRRVCTTCGQPSRRITADLTLDSYRTSSRPQTIRAVALADSAGLTDEHIAAVRAFGTSDAGKAPTLNNGAGKNTDEVKRLAGEAKDVLGGYFREFVQSTTATRQSTWSDCGHNTWRPGRVLDPFVGSGTTLAVCSGMARDAVGIDLDYTNAGLALERVGMFLDVVWPEPDFTLTALYAGDSDRTVYRAWLTDKDAQGFLEALTDLLHTGARPAVIVATHTPRRPPALPLGGLFADLDMEAV